MTIKPGAGGTESRTGLRFCCACIALGGAPEFNAVVLDETPGEEAGIKNATIQFTGEMRTDFLSGETGVHRLVRDFSFRSGGARHTSFASVFVIPEVDDRIEIDIKAR